MGDVKASGNVRQVSSRLSVANMTANQPSVVNDLVRERDEARQRVERLEAALRELVGEFREVASDDFGRIGRNDVLDRAEALLVEPAAEEDAR